MRRISRAPAFTAASRSGDSTRPGVFTSSPGLLRILTQDALSAIGKCQNHLRERGAYIADWRLSIANWLKSGRKPIDNRQLAIGNRMVVLTKKETAMVAASNKEFTIMVSLRDYLNHADAWPQRIYNRGACIFHRHQQTEVRECDFRFNLGFVTSARVYDLAKFDELITWRDRPKCIHLAGRSVFQFMETHVDFRHSPLSWSDENIRPRAFQGAAKINLHLSVVALLVCRYVEHRHRVCRRSCADLRRAGSDLFPYRVGGVWNHREPFRHRATEKYGLRIVGG